MNGQATAPQSTIRIFLWAHPRCISTAFERTFVERKDTTTYHEPFSQSFYYSDERQHQRYAAEAVQPAFNYEKTWNTLLKPVSTPISFTKDMASFIVNRMDPKYLSQFTNTFIIREPTQALCSFYKRWPDFDFVEAGYEQLFQLFKIVTEQLGQKAVVIDADDLKTRPRELCQKYCSLVGIPFDEKALEWQPKQIQSWGIWDGWHDVAQESSGIDTSKVTTHTDIPPKVQELAEKCQPFYQQLYAARIRL